MNTKGLSSMPQVYRAARQAAYVEAYTALLPPIGMYRSRWVIHAGVYDRDGRYQSYFVPFRNLDVAGAKLLLLAEKLGLTCRGRGEYSNIPREEYLRGAAMTGRQEEER